MNSASQELHKFGEIIKKSILIEDGNPARYRLQTSTDNLDQFKPYRKMTYGERDTNKPRKIILMVGETGTGKTTLINVMINYMLGVQREDKVWFEITDDQSDRTSAHSQTSRITVYGFYPQESPIHLTIIDTPGYGQTCDIQNDKQIAESLLSLSTSEKEIHEIDAVCLVIMAHQNRLSDRQIYIFDAVQSLFGRDIVENIVLLFTHSTGAHPKNVLMAVEDAEIKCVENDKNQPVFFLFDNCQSDAADEEDEEHKMIQERSWNLSFKGTAGLFNFLDKVHPKTLQMTQDVLQKWKQLNVNISNLQSQVKKIELKQNELSKAQKVLKQNKENKNFEYEDEVPYKEKVDIDPSEAKEMMCCTVCQENCHYPNSILVKIGFGASVIKNDYCTVCTNKCHYTKHVKEAKKYVTNIKKEKKTDEELKRKYDDKIRESVSLVKKLEEELRELEMEKVKRVMEAFHCVETLEMIARNADSLFTLQHIDSLIEKLKEIKEPEKVKILENIKRRAGEGKHRALEYIKGD